MAPFLAHLTVGERLWDEMGSRPESWADQYGTFLFGCLAPDVDKFCDGLSQATTHFVAKDERFAWVEERTQRFLDQQAALLRAPFPDLSACEQAFVAGYMCHVSTDEVTGRYARLVRQDAERMALPTGWIDAFLTTFDPWVWTLARDRERIVEGLGAAAIPDGTLRFVPGECLTTMHHIVWPQIRDGGGLIPYLAMMRRSRYWRRHGQISDEQDDPEIEANLAGYRRQMEAALPVTQKMVAAIDIEAFVDQAVEHSRERVGALLAPAAG